MELRNKAVLQEYVADIVEQDKAEERPILNQNFLNTFLQILTTAELSPKKFPISLASACRLLKMDKNNFQRIIDPKLSRRKNKDTGFLEDIDFVRAPPQKTLAKGTPLMDLDLSVTCFKEAMMQVLKSKGDQARRYFSLAEGAYRDTQGEELQASIRSDDEATRKRKRDYLRPLRSLPNQPYHYAYSFHKGDHDFIYPGVTNNPFRRLSRHSQKVEGDIKIHHIEHDDKFDPEELEIVENRSMRPWQVPVPYQSKGSPSVKYNDDPHIYDLIEKAAVKHLHELDDSMKADLAKAGIVQGKKPEAVKTLKEYPVPLQERKHKPSWRDYAAADYSTNPPSVSLLK
jgi:phage anti-repressor protein